MNLNKQEFISLLEKRLFQLPQVEKEHLLFIIMKRLRTAWRTA